MIARLSGVDLPEQWESWPIEAGEPKGRSGTSSRQQTEPSLDRLPFLVFAVEQIYVPRPMLPTRRRRQPVVRWRRIVISRSGIAIAAAYLLVLQATFAGLASGSRAASISLDHELPLSLCAGGNTTPADADHSKPAVPHADLSCCTAGCSVSANGLPAEASFEAVLHHSADEATFSGHLNHLQAFRAGRSSANPRAPPELI